MKIDYELEVNALPVTLAGKLEMISQIYLPQPSYDIHGNQEFNEDGSPVMCDPLIKATPEEIISALDS